MRAARARSAGPASSGCNKEPLSVVTHMHVFPRAACTPTSGRASSHTLPCRNDVYGPARPLFFFLASHTWGCFVRSSRRPQPSIIKKKIHSSRSRFHEALIARDKNGPKNPFLVFVCIFFFNENGTRFGKATIEKRNQDV